MLSIRRFVVLLLFASVVAGCSPIDPIARIEDQRTTHSERLIGALQEGPSEQRVRAAVAIGRIQSPGYATALAEAADDDDREVRLAALFAMGQIGLAEGVEIPPVTVEACLGAPEDEDAGILLAALEALGKLAVPDTAVSVSGFLTHPSPTIRREAALALFRFRFVPLWRRVAEEPPALPAEATAALIEALVDADREVRWAAAYAFSRYGEAEAALWLGTLIDDEDERVRLFALRSIGRSGDDSLAGVVRLGMTDSSERVRTEAVIALAALSSKERFPPDLVSDPSVHVRAALARALADCEGEGTAAMLQDLIDDPSVTVRAAAVAATARQLGEAYAGELALHLEEVDWRIRATAAGAAANAGSRAIDLVSRAMQDEDIRVRTAAIGALADIEGGGELLLSALASEDLAIRGTAVEVVSGRDDPAKLDRLAKTYDASVGVEWIEIREAVVGAVAELDGAEPLLRRMATEDSATSVRRRARLALAARGIELEDESRGKRPLSPFLSVAFDEDPVVVMETSKGEIVIRCLAGEAPNHVASFVKLVGEGYYDGLIWHRVVPNFVIQGGDPRGDGWGGAGYTLRDEINTRRYTRGSVGMPKAGKDTGGGQLFITHILTPHLDGNYTIFGEVTSGLDVVDRIEVGDRIVRARLR